MFSEYQTEWQHQSDYAHPRQYNDLITASYIILKGCVADCYDIEEIANDLIDVSTEQRNCFGAF